MYDPKRSSPLLGICSKVIAGYIPAAHDHISTVLLSSKPLENPHLRHGDSIVKHGVQTPALDADVARGTLIGSFVTIHTYCLLKFIRLVSLPASQVLCIVLKCMHPYTKEHKGSPAIEESLCEAVCPVPESAPHPHHMPRSSIKCHSKQGGCSWGPSCLMQLLDWTKFRSRKMDRCKGALERT